MKNIRYFQILKSKLMKSEHYSFVGGIKGDVKSNFLIHTKCYKTSFETINAFEKILQKSLKEIKSGLSGLFRR